jgi:hypothetical protein
VNALFEHVMDEAKRRSDTADQAIFLGKLIGKLVVEQQSPMEACADPESVNRAVNPEVYAKGSAVGSEE